MDDHDEDDQVPPWTVRDTVAAWVGEDDVTVYRGHWERRPSIPKITAMIMDGLIDGLHCPERRPYHAINYDEERRLCEEMGAACFCVDDIAAMVRDAAHTIIDHGGRTKEERTKEVREELVGTGTRLLAQRTSLPNPYAVEYAVRVAARVLSLLFEEDFPVDDLYTVMTTDKAVANFHQSVDELKEDEEFVENVENLGTKFELEALNELALEHLGSYDNRRGGFVLDKHAKTVVANVFQRFNDDKKE
jgi:hypothetical protein